LKFVVQCFYPQLSYAVAKKCFKCTYYLRHVCVLHGELLSTFSQDLVLRSSVDAFKCCSESAKNNGPLHVCLRLERGTLSVTTEKIIQTIFYEMLIKIGGFKLKTTEEYKVASNCTPLQESNVLDSCNGVQSA